MTVPGKHIRVSVMDDEYRIGSTCVFLCLHGYQATSFIEPLEALQVSRFDAPDLLTSEVSISLQILIPTEPDQELLMAARSVFVNLVNRSDTVLIRTTFSLSHRIWTHEPPLRIEAWRQTNLGDPNRTASPQGPKGGHLRHPACSCP